MTDISHEFTFYFDGRFGSNYVAPDGIDVRNWGTLHKYDLSSANLLVLQSSASPCPYLPADIRAVGTFLSGGGIVVLSVAMGRDLFPWFRSLGITVDSRESQLRGEAAFTRLQR